MHVQVCEHIYVREQIHQCKHIDLSAGELVHCVTLPMVSSSKLITHDEMINLVYVPLSVQCTQPYALFLVSPRLSAVLPSLISLTTLQQYRLTKSLKRVSHSSLKLLCLFCVTQCHYTGTVGHGVKRTSIFVFLFILFCCFKWWNETELQYGIEFWHAT